MPSCRRSCFRSDIGERDRLQEAVALLTEFRDYVSAHATQWDNGGAQHHQPIWKQVADFLAE